MLNSMTMGPSQLKDYAMHVGHESVHFNRRGRENGLDLNGAFHSGPDGAISDIFRFSLAAGKINRLEYWAGNPTEILCCPRRGLSLFGRFLNA